MYFQSLDINLEEETLDYLHTHKLVPISTHASVPPTLCEDKEKEGTRDLNECVREQGLLCAGAAVDVTSVRPVGSGDPVRGNRGNRPGQGFAGRCRTPGVKTWLWPIVEPQVAKVW